MSSDELPLPLSIFDKRLIVLREFFSFRQYWNGEPLDTSLCLYPVSIAPPLFVKLYIVVYHKDSA